MAKTEACMITTIDNPFNPFTQFVDWLQYDDSCGYGTCEYLSRFAFPSDQLSENENNEIVEQAIDDIIANDPRKIYKKVYEKDFK